MNFDFEDASSLLKSLRDKVKKVFDTVTIIPQRKDPDSSLLAEKLGTRLLAKDAILADDAEDHFTDTRCRKSRNCRRGEIKIILSNMEENVIDPELINGVKKHRQARRAKSCEDLSYTTNNTNNTRCSLIGQSKFDMHSGELPDSAALSESFAYDLLNKSRTKMLEFGRELNESLRDIFFNSSSNIVRARILLSRSSESISDTMLSRNSESISDKSQLSYRSSSVNSVKSSSLSDSCLTCSSSTNNSRSHATDLSCIKSDSRNESEDIRCNTSSPSLNTSFRIGSSLTDSYKEYHQISDLSSSTSLTSKTSSMSNISAGSSDSRSFKAEFKHDIDFLARVTNKTSTPESSPIPIRKPSGEYRRNLALDNSNKFEENQSSNGVSGIIPADGNVVKKFVHGPSPLCKLAHFKQKNTLSYMSGRLESVQTEDPVAPTTQVENPSLETRLINKPSNSGVPQGRARRSLFSFSAMQVLKAFPNLAQKDFVAFNTDQSISKNRAPGTRMLSHGQLPLSPNVKKHETFESEILPKHVFRDEADEAVYYLITKYLENENCVW